MHVFSVEKEYFRLVGQIYYTEEGAYKELPDNISSAYIQVEVVYYIVMVTSSGELRVFPFNNKPAKDKGNNPGGPVSFGGTVFYTEPGGGSKELVLSRNYNERLTSNERARADAMWETVIASGVKWYE